MARIAKSVVRLLFGIGLVLPLLLTEALAANPQVEFETSRGNFVMELFPDKAPKTVENFLRYVNNGFYAGTVFHRAIPKFLVQGGGFTEALEPKSTWSPIASESTNGLSNQLGTVAMAHGASADSATSQFFVNLADNRFLNYYRPEAGLEGYTVFGRIVRGLEVLQAVSAGATTSIGKLVNVPAEPTIIHSARILDSTVVAEAPLPVVEPEEKEKKSKLVKKGKKRGKT